MTEQQFANHEPTCTKGEDEISLIDLLIVLAKNKKMILGMTFGAAVIAAAYSLTLPNIYTGTTKILPPQQSMSGTSLIMDKVGALASFGGGALGVKNPNDLYVGMLNSRTLADNIIMRFKLKELYKLDLLEDTRVALKASVNIAAGKDGIIVINVDDKDPKRAAEIANAYVDELYKINQVLAVTDASKRRLFFEKQLKLAKNELAVAEIAMKKTQEQSGIIKLDGQAESIIQAVSGLRGQISAKEVQLAAMRSFATERNPDFVLTQTELAGLRTQLSAMEKAQGPRGGDVPVSTGRLPEAGLEYIRKFRDVKYGEAVYELLVKQYEMAKIDEAKDASLIQVLDKAVVPERKSKPKLTLIVLIAMLVGCLFGIILAFIREANERIKTNPQQAERLQIFRRYMWGK
jgi:uncharacterized protein involved in exopolysaccharide biosynthesis